MTDRVVLNMNKSDATALRDFLGLAKSTATAETLPKIEDIYKRLVKTLSK